LTQSSKDAIKRITPEIKALRERYPTLREFIDGNKPDRQFFVRNNLIGCYIGKSPTLVTMKQCYGENAPSAWLMTQILETAYFQGLKEMPDEYQLSKTAKLIESNYYYLKTDEILVFCFRFNSGKYEHFYSTFDPSIIMKSLKAFVLDRTNEIFEYDNYRNRCQRYKDSKKCVTYDEYKAIKESKQRQKNKNISSDSIDDSNKKEEEI